MVEASAKRVTGDEPQGSMGRARCLLPAFLCAHIFIKRETSGYEAGSARLRTLSYVLTYGAWGNLVPRALFPGVGGGAAGKAREKRLGDEVGPAD